MIEQKDKQIISDLIDLILDDLVENEYFNTNQEETPCFSDEKELCESDLTKKAAKTLDDNNISEID